MKTRVDLIEELKTNPGVIIVKLGATWCKPCQLIDPVVTEFMQSITSPTIRCHKVDIDEAFDLYAFLKNKKMVNGIPVLLAYYKGNSSYVPDDSISGTDAIAIRRFFMRSSERA